VGKEKRRGPRGPVSATVVLLRQEKQLGSFKVLNLSTVGALLVGRPPAGPPDGIEVLVRLSTGRTVRAGATIVREDSVDDASVFAVAFAPVSAEDHEIINSVVLTALDDARDATALIVAATPEAWHLLRRQLDGLGHPSFVVGTREDAVRFLEAPNVVTVALIDLALAPAEVEAVLVALVQKRPAIRRIVMASEGKARAGTSGHPLAQAVLPKSWKREALARVLAP
jgi:hypothetical protein